MASPQCSCDTVLWTSAIFMAKRWWQADQKTPRQPSNKGLTLPSGKTNRGAGKTAPQLRALAALLEKPGSIPAPTGKLTTFYDSSFWISATHFWPSRARHTWFTGIHANSHTHKIKILKIKSQNKKINQEQPVKQHYNCGMIILFF